MGVSPDEYLEMLQTEISLVNNDDEYDNVDDDDDEEEGGNKKKEQQQQQQQDREDALAHNDNDDHVTEYIGLDDQVSCNDLSFGEDEDEDHDNGDANVSPAGPDVDDDDDDIDDKENEYVDVDASIKDAMKKLTIEHSNDNDEFITPADEEKLHRQYQRIEMNHKKLRTEQKYLRAQLDQMTQLCMHLMGELENMAKHFAAEREERQAEYQSERQSHDAQMADILYLKPTMVEEYEIERVERQKLFLKDQQQRTATITPVAPSAAASFLRDEDNISISDKSSLHQHFPSTKPSDETLIHA